MPQAAKIVLHVDDDVMMAKLVRKVLERIGYTVEWARNSGEAMSVLAEREPTVILLDVNIGDEDGYTLCELIRAVGATAPIAFLTANRTAEDVKLARAAGGDYFIAKPISPTTLVAGIDRAIAMRQRVAHSS